ncbi:hypothetical protein [Pseudomonas proteolytica]|uniref:hypothetical protein n=1 Tax=Pseudomonas proteolytica TaxID=219574 RepID=UPI00147467F8|nr:hypothetical protein [Pseudomonas proteolytica]NMZ40424.1 hypothetical protein [Pseudomonas proteolytica]
MKNSNAITDYTELQRLAEAALRNWPDSKLFERPECERFIDAARPEVILALIAENERLESERADLWRGKRDAEATRDTKSAVIAELKAEIAGLRTGYEAYERVNAELKADNEALRKERDARHPFKPFHEPSIGYTGCVICGVFTDHGGLPCPKTRATADAALGQGEQS